MPALARTSRALYALWDSTLNSVKFGIALMVALALYVAIGSGFASLRAWMEMTDLEFFNWWPMRALAALLVANLLTVSMTRIPLTLPRLGVWCIHLGIIVLVFGMVRYFSAKTEGLTLVRSGEEVDWYYDAEQRALYVTAGDRKARPIPLDDLPRFEAYAAEFGNADRLDRPTLRGLTPAIFDYDPAARDGRLKPVHEAVGGEGDEPVRVDVIGYYPYAVVGSAYERGGDLTGLRLTLREPATGEEQRRFAVADQPGHDGMAADAEQVARIRLRHLHRDDALTGDALLAAASRAHELGWRVGGHDGDLKSITLQPGERVPLGDSGYAVEAVAALPDFPLSGTGELADAFELLIHPPTGETFRRYVLAGRDVETDFVLGVEGAGPKGERQTELVDTNLHLHYNRADGLGLLPRGGEDERHTVLTKAARHDRVAPRVPRPSGRVGTHDLKVVARESTVARGSGTNPEPGDAGFWHLVTRHDAPARLERVDEGRLELAINGQIVDPHTQVSRPASYDLDVERVDGLRRNSWVRPVPPIEREADAARAGTFQVASVRVSRGGWSEVVQVPFTQWVDQQAWRPASVRVPGLPVPVKLQLGNTRHPIGGGRAPVRVRLDDFELVPYAGDFTENSAMRDFRSHLTVAGEPATVKLNSPHYFNTAGPLGGESWLLYQNQWDPENQAFTVLGVANRPGIWPMLAGCAAVAFGLGWAFYVKPVLLRRQRAEVAAKTQRERRAAKPEREFV